MSPTTLADAVDFVYFDVDDTLLDHSYAEREALADLRSRYLTVFGHLSVDQLQDTYHQINRPLWRRYTGGEVEKETVKRDRFRRLLEAVDAPQADAARIGSVYLQRYAEHWAFVDGAWDAYAAIAERYPVGLLTNGFAEVQSRKLKKFPEIRDHAAVVLVSEETGHMKPHPRVFDVAAERAGTSPDRILYVGDSWRSDVEGGTRAGWRVAWYARNAEEGREMNGRSFAFREWSDLLARL